eukprot:XP_011668689.1 PREDICTED: neural cell adhesion molecule 1-like [Strongylocentrotus purpuratus]
MSTRIWNPQVLPVVGENITLACIYTPPSTSRLLSWQDENGNILAIDKCQGVGCSNELNVPDVSKYSLRADSSSGNLTIRDLTLDDSGRYQCLVGTFSDAASDAIDLKVVLSAEPRLLSITDGRTETGYKNGESVSITSGRTHNLTCSVQDARPPAKLEWHIPEEVQVQLKDQYNAVHGDAYTSRRVVSVTPSRDDDGKVFRCVASHRELDNELQIFIQLDVQVPPNDLQLTAYGSIAINVTETRSVNVFEDSATSFTCNSVGSRPKAVISWIIGSDDDLGSTTSTSTTNEADQSLRDTKSILQLIPRRRHHNKLLRCVAHAGINQSHTEVRVIVFGPPDSPYLSGMGWLQDGVSSNMTCTSNNGYPAPTFQWYLGSKNVTKDSNTESSRNIDHRLDAMSVLNFTPTVDEDGELLVCQVVQRNASSVKSWSVSEILHVLYSPAIVDYSVRRVYIGHHNVDAMLTCISESRPLASITWFLNGKELINGTRHHIHHSHPQEDTLRSSILIIVNISAEDDGNYTCLAATRLGSDRATITFSFSATPGLLSITDDWSEGGYVNGASVSITSGRTHNLTCSVQDARPPAELEWHVPEEVQIRLEDHTAK